MSFFYLRSRALYLRPSLSYKPLWVIVCLWVSLLGNSPLALGQATLYPTFVNKTTANGLGNDFVNGVYVVSDTVYAATIGGLSISTDGGNSFINKTTDDGLGNNYVRGVFVVNDSVYAATFGGLSISKDGGKTFINKTTDDGLGSNLVTGVYVDGLSVYVATLGGRSFSKDGGMTFTNVTSKNGSGLQSNNVFSVYEHSYFSIIFVYAATDAGLNISAGPGGGLNRTTANGLGSNFVSGISGNADGIYVATSGGLSLSNDVLGSAFVNKTTANGLGNNFVNGVFATPSYVYAATQSGLSISNDKSKSFSNRTTANGLGNDFVNGVYESAGIVYAATNGGLSISVNAQPVELISFTGGWQAKQGAVLSWQTAWEKNNDHFEIQRSTDAKSFETIGRVVGKGSQQTTTDYAFTDAQIPDDLVYYRLKQVDTDGAYTFSSIIPVQRGMDTRPAGLIISPNPVQKTLTLNLSAGQPKTVRIFDTAGRLLQTASTLTPDVSGLMAGTYIVETTTTSGQVLKQRFVKE